MVRNLTNGIKYNKSEKKADILASQIPKKEENPKFIIDGAALAFHVLTNGDTTQNADFVHGGDYGRYQEAVHAFFKVLKKLEAECAIVFSVPDNETKESRKAINEKKKVEQMRRINVVRQILDKNFHTSRKPNPILPPFMRKEIIEAASKDKIPVIITSNNVAQFSASVVSSGEFDALIANAADYFIFEGLNYIPIDSFYTNEQDELHCEYYNTDIVQDILQLNDKSKLVDLTVLLGNDYTEDFVVSKYQIPTLLHIKLNAKYPAALCEGIVDYLNKEEYEGLENSDPFKEIIQNDPEFKEAIKQSHEFYEIQGGIAEENNSLIGKQVNAMKLPGWILGVSQGGDFWYKLTIDDFKHEIQATKITQPLRKIIYGILGREEVVEHLPRNEEIVEEKVEGDKDLPSFEKLHKMKADKLEKVLYNIIHQNFPQPPEYKKDPLNKFEDPVKTIGLALRFLVSQCYTENQTPFTKTPAENKAMKDAGVIGAPPVDYFELSALAAQALCLCLLKPEHFEAPSFKPTLRRVHVASLYQSTLLHIIWLQQVFGQKCDKVKPHRLFDGEIFAAAYDSKGEFDDKFAAYWLQPEKLAKFEDKRLKPFLDAVLFPFPEDLFEQFQSVPRSIPTSAFQEAKPVAINIKVGKSAFAGLMDDEEDDAEPIELPPAPVMTPPPPPAAAPKKKEAKPVMDEDEEMEFLLAAAAQNKKSGNKPKPAPAPVQKKNKGRGPPRRRVEKVNLNEVRTFNHESKLDAKLQTKQQGFEW